MDHHVKLVAMVLQLIKLHHKNIPCFNDPFHTPNTLNLAALKPKKHLKPLTNHILEHPFEKYTPDQIRYIDDALSKKGYLDALFCFMAVICKDDDDDDDYMQYFTKEYDQKLHQPKTHSTGTSEEPEVIWID